MAYREQLGFPIVDAFVQDVRFAVRMLTRDRGFAITAILVLGIGIGVNNMMFTLIYGSTLRGLPIARARSRAVRLDVRPAFSRSTAAPFRSSANCATRRGASGPGRLRDHAGLGGDDGRRPIASTATYLTANAFSLIIGTAPILGRTFRDATTTSRAPIRSRFSARTAWRSRYAATRHSRPHDPRRRQRRPR